MTQMDIPARQKSQRLINRQKTSQQYQQFQQYRLRAKNITSANELLPGLNDISDAIEALPIYLVKYFTLLKEIDAKCINSIPVINHQIKDYIESLHPVKEEDEKMDRPTQIKKLTGIRNRIHQVIPCMEEKMHVATVASDLLNKHLFRIENDYKLIINNNEIPESIRIGPLNHPAMIMDSSNPSDHANPNRSAQSQRSESRREALAARKANKDDDEDDRGKRQPKPTTKDPTPFSEAKPNNNKKKTRKEPPTPPIPAAQTDLKVEDKKRAGSARPKRERDEYESDEGPRAAPPNSSNSNEPTYCYCNQVSFGEMVGCDGDDCKREWFHLPCIGFKNPPKGKWYCDDCWGKMKKVKRV